MNKYLLQQEELLAEAGQRARIFPQYDDEWLDFYSWQPDSGQDLWKEYDYIEGGVANDRVVDTIDLYMTGFIPRFEAIERLKYLRPNNQICISSQILIDKYLFSRIVL